MSDDVETVKGLWQAAEDAYNRGDVDSQLADVAEGIVLHSVAGGGFLDGRAAAKESQASVRERFSEARFTSSKVQGRSFGETVVLWGNCEFVLQPHDGDPVTMVARFSSTWSRIDGKWVDVMNHYTQT